MAIAGISSTVETKKKYSEREREKSQNEWKLVG